MGACHLDKHRCEIRRTWTAEAATAVAPQGAQRNSDLKGPVIIGGL